jgi:hypothetical protein
LASFVSLNLPYATVPLTVESCSFWHHRVSEKKGGGDASNNSDSVASDGKNSVVFDFDQVDRHRKFWEYLRNKEWQAVATFFEKKVRSVRSAVW